MSAKRASINIYLPTVNHFPELKHFGDREHREHQQQQQPCGRISMLTKNNNNNSEPSGIVNKTAGAVGEDDLEGSGHSLYVVDSRGSLLEHVRYDGRDYRCALRAAVTARWKP